MEGGLLEVAAAILAATVVEDEDDIAFLSHVGLPGTGSPMPGGLYVVGVRTAIDIDHGGVFLSGAEVVGLHKAVIEVGLVVGGLDGAAFE